MFGAGGRSESSVSPLPSSTLALFNRKMQLVDEVNGEIITDSPYFIRLDNGVVFHGNTDSGGLTEMTQDQAALSGRAFFGHEAMKLIAKFKGST